jgi:hypothetical protein
MCRTQIICLANSAKKQERCVAGIELGSKQWIRPVSLEYPDDGRVPSSTPVVGTGNVATLASAQLLDVLEIPLDTTGPDFDFECENRTIVPGDWNLVRQASFDEIVDFINLESKILHNSYKYVPISILQALPFSERKTLELVYTDVLKTTSFPRQSGGSQWKGSFSMRNGLSFTELTITDPILLNKLDQGYEPEAPCLITLSLSMPREFDGWTGPPKPCWKLIAGVVELSLNDQIRIEMRLASWCIQQAKQYIQRTYQKNSRQEMTDEEKVEFISHLKGVNGGRNQE